MNVRTPEFHAVFVVSFSQVMPVRLAALDLYQQAFSDLECFEKVLCCRISSPADPTGWVESNPLVFKQKHGTSPKLANDDTFLGLSKIDHDINSTGFQHETW